MIAYNLLRDEYIENGIFGRLLDEAGNLICYTLEHAYSSGDAFIAKVAPGTYTCVRHAPNRLPYTTFELQDVPPFQGKPVTGVLLHVGNYNKDSDGCVLLGSNIIEDEGVPMLAASKVAFDKFMTLNNTVNSFTLTIGDKSV